MHQTQGPAAPGDLAGGVAEGGEAERRVLDTDDDGCLDRCRGAARSITSDTSASGRPRNLSANGKPGRGLSRRLRPSARSPPTCAANLHPLTESSPPARLAADSVLLHTDGRGAAVGAGRAVRSAVVINPVKVVDLDALRAHRRRHPRRGRLAGAALVRDHRRGPGPRPDPAGGRGRRRAGLRLRRRRHGDAPASARWPAPTWRSPCCRPAPATCSPPTSASPATSPPGSRWPSSGAAGGSTSARSSDDVFAVMAGMGFDAQMLDATSETTKARIGWPAYVVGAARHLRDRPMRVSIRIDDAPAAAPARPLGAGRQRRPAAGRRTAAHRRRARRRLARRGGAHPAQPAALARAGLGGDAPPRPGARMEIFRGRRVEIASNRAQPRELDGDLIEPGRQLSRRDPAPGALALRAAARGQRPDLAVRRAGRRRSGASELVEEVAP